MLLQEEEKEEGAQWALLITSDEMLIAQFQWGCMMLAVQLHLTGRCIWVAIISNDAPFFAAMSFPSITIAVPPPPPTPTQPSANHRRRPVILEEHLDQNLSRQAAQVFYI